MIVVLGAEVNFFLSEVYRRIGPSGRVYFVADDAAAPAVVREGLSDPN